MAYTILLHKNPIQTFAQVMHGFSHMHNSLQTKAQETRRALCIKLKVVFPRANTM